VRMNGAPVKASRTVGLGDRYDIRTPARKWTIEVTGLLHNRADYETARKHYADLTSEEDLRASQRMNTSFYTGKRLSKTGRPSKKQRRDLNDFFGDEISAD
jgi:ribosome-associated heat shock protein Hsp15